MSLLVQMYIAHTLGAHRAQCCDLKQAGTGVGRAQDCEKESSASLNSSSFETNTPLSLSDKSLDDVDETDVNTLLIIQYYDFNQSIGQSSEEGAG